MTVFKSPATAGVLRIASLLLFVAFAACGGDGTAPDPPPVTQPPPTPPPPPPPPVTEPPTQGPTGLSFGDVSATSMRLSWTNGDGEGRMVIAREGTDVDASPADGTTYAHDTQFGLGEDLGEGNFVVYAGSGSDVAVSDLTPGAQYFFAIYEYNGTGDDIKYQRGDRAAGDRPTDGRASDLIGSWFWGAAPRRQAQCRFHGTRRQSLHDRRRRYRRRRGRTRRRTGSLSMEPLEQPPQRPAEYRHQWRLGLVRDDSIQPHRERQRTDRHRRDRHRDDGPRAPLSPPTPSWAPGCRWMLPIRTTSWWSRSWTTSIGCWAWTTPRTQPAGPEWSKAPTSGTSPQGSSAQRRHRIRAAIRA